MNARAVYEQGEAHLGAGEWLQASRCFAEVLQLLPDHGCAHHLLGKAQARLGALEAAEALQSRSCELDPALGWNWFALAELREQRGALQAALEAFVQAAARLPQARWIKDRARHLERQLAWCKIRSLAVQPRIGLDELVQIVWQLRPDLRNHLGDDQDELRLWLLLEGPQEYLAAMVLRDELIAYFLPLTKQQALLPSLELGAAVGSGPPISQLLHEIWWQQPHLQRRFDLATLAGRVGLFWWYVLEAVPHYQLHPLLSNAALAYMHELVAIDEASSVSRLALAARRLSGASVPDDQLDAWFWSVAVRQLRLGDLVCSERMPPPRTEGDLVQEHQPLLAASPKPFGVNLIGYAQGQLGIGEDLRMAAIALDAVGVPCSIYNIEPDASIHCDDNTLSDRLSESLPYVFNLFCLTGMETARIVVKDYLPMMLPGHVNIGYWPWEFSRWPAHWSVAFRVVDEVWASTRFTADAYKEDAALPVQLMPMLVDVSPSAGFSRLDFGLPLDVFLFCFSFDCSSSIRRKNPWAVLEAFQSAFPLSEGAPVGLVVKVMRGQLRKPAYRRLLQRAESDPRIYLLEETLPRDVLLDLYRVCDAYVSLHRCEGFGRGMAEAMLLDKPVIATGYSGNIDFCTESTALVVPAPLRQVLPGEYPEAQGMQWAEPDTRLAAEAMRQCVLEKWLPDAGAVAEVKDRYSAQRVGSRYLQRLEKLMASMI